MLKSFGLSKAQIKTPRFARQTMICFGRKSVVLAFLAKIPIALHKLSFNQGRERNSLFIA